MAGASKAATSHATKRFVSSKACVSLTSLVMVITCTARRQVASGASMELKLLIPHDGFTVIKLYSHSTPYDWDFGWVIKRPSGDVYSLRIHHTEGEAVADAKAWLKANP